MTDPVVGVERSVAASQAEAIIAESLHSNGGRTWAQSLDEAARMLGRDRDDLIRRQDAALTAVRELADQLAEPLVGYTSVRAVVDQVRRDCSVEVRRALASPDTTQEADRG